MSVSNDPFPQHRPNVGIVLFNKAGLVWIGRRSDLHNERRWQFPQGGVDPGEDLEIAARRELREETGVHSLEILDRTTDWQTYDFPPQVVARDKAQGRPGWLGQKQIWFAMRFTGDDAEIDLATHDEPEFDQWRWTKLQEVTQVCAVFKLDVYTEIISAFGKYGANS